MVSMTENALFMEKVKELIPEQSDQEKVFETLKRYQSSQDLGGLLTDLRLQLNHPTKLELYEHIRPLVLPKHQLEYSQKTPQTPGIKLRVIRLKRQPGESLGFAVRGGFEHGIGVFVSEVQQRSQAEKRGLRVGDEIVRVNGFTITEAIHEDVLNLIKSRDEIVLKVTHIGMLPVKSKPNETVTWNYVENMDSSKALQEVLEKESQSGKRGSTGPDIRIFINTNGVASIGCGIVSGPAHFQGIYVEKVRPGSLAEEVGLEVGDQIVEVNGTTFNNISHKEAVVTLKSSTQLNMVIKKKLGLPLFQQKQRQRKPEPAANFRPSIVSLTEEPTPAPSVQPQIRTLRETNEAVSHRTSEPEDRGDSGIDQEQIIQQHLAKGKFLTTVTVENPHPKEPQDDSQDDALPPPPPPEVLESMHRDAAYDVEAMTSFSMRSTEREAVSEVSSQMEAGGSALDFDDDEQDETDSRKKPLVLGGKAAIIAARQAMNKGPTLLGARQAMNKGPTLLGASSHSGHVDMDHITDLYALFPPELTDGKELAMVSVTLDNDESLGIGVEGGIGTPLADKILIADLYGAAERNGELEKGDQVLMAAGRSFLDLSSAQAVNILREAENKNMGSVKLIVAKGGLVNDEDAVTYF